jgi:hypothetical protein
VVLDFVPEWAIDLGEFGCADVARGHGLPPGGALSARLQWRGELASGPLPTSEVEITATFARQTPGGRGPELTARLPIWLDGDDTEWLSVGQAVDFALAHSDFAEWVRAGWTPLRGGPRRQAVAKFDAATGTWQIGLEMLDRETRVVILDATTGRRLDYVQARVSNNGDFVITGPVE